MNTLNKNNLKIVEIFNDNSQENGLLIKKDRTVVNDGRKLLEVFIKEAPEHQDDKDVIIDIQTVKTVLAMAGNNTVMVSQKHLNYPNVGEVTFEIRDSECTKTIQAKPVEGKYPDYEEVYPKADPILTIGFSPKYLAEIFSKVEEIINPDDADIYPYNSVKLEFYSSDKPVKFSAEGMNGQKIQGLLMPVSL